MSLPQSAPHSMQYTHQDIFSTVQNSFELIDFDVSAAVFIFATSPTLAKSFPLRTFFIQGNTHKKIHSG